jgi:23S rRNA-/tRNA-specific pseudouridylate synthase
MIRVDKFLSDKIDTYSRTKIQQAQTMDFYLQTAPYKSNYKIKPGDVITIELDYPKHELEIIPEQIPLDIHYEDEHLIVIHKPPGMVVHPDTEITQVLWLMLWPGIYAIIYNLNRTTHARDWFTELTKTHRDFW